MYTFNRVITVNGITNAQGQTGSQAGSLQDEATVSLAPSFGCGGPLVFFEN